MNQNAPLITKAFLLQLAKRACGPAFPSSQGLVPAFPPDFDKGGGLLHLPVTEDVRGERVRYAGKAKRGPISMTPNLISDNLERGLPDDRC
jgi:hypothetical protein